MIGDDEQAYYLGMAVETEGLAALGVEVPPWMGYRAARGGGKWDKRRRG
jgi:hypothetical protein